MAERQLKPKKEEWERYKEEIISLYQQTTLGRVMELMNQRHGFSASKSQYTTKLDKWGVRKYSNNEKWQFADTRIQKRKSEGKASSVFLYGKQLSQKMVEKAIKRNVSFTNSCYNSNVAQDAPTPDGLVILTPPETTEFQSLSFNIRTDNLPWLLFDREVQAQTMFYKSIHETEQTHSLIPTIPNVGESSDLFGHTFSDCGFPNVELFRGYEDLVSNSTYSTTFDLNSGLFDIEAIFHPLPNSGLLWDPLDPQMNGSTGITSNLDVISTGQVESTLFSMLFSEREIPCVKSLERFCRYYMVDDNSLKCYTPSNLDNQRNTASYSNPYKLFSLFVFMVTNNLLKIDAVADILAWAAANNFSWVFTEILKLRLTTIDVFATKLLPAAVRAGDVELLHKLVARNVDINIPISNIWNGKFRNVLSLAVGDRNLQIVETLCDFGSTPEILQNDFRTVKGSRESLWSHRNIAILRTLLKYGADPECFVLDEARGFPLISAASEGSVEAVSQLLAAGANVNCSVLDFFGTALQAASACGHAEVVRILIEANSDVNAWYVFDHFLDNPIEIRNCHRSLITPIQLAARSDHAEIVQLLVQSGALVNFCPVIAHFGLQKLDVVFSTYEYEIPDEIPPAFAIQYAAQNENIPLVHQLLAAGANVDSRIGTNYGDTPLQLAVRSGNVDLTLLLLKYNANVNAPPGKYNGRTALQAAAEIENFTLIQILLDAGANVNASAGWSNGRTAIQAALEKGHILAARLLLLADADINAEPAFHRGLTALQASVAFGDIEILEEILGHGADINAAAGPEEGLTALEAAVDHRNIHLLDFLLKAGADVNALPSKGLSSMTALQRAVYIGWLEGVQLLLSYGPHIDILPLYEYYNYRRNIWAYTALGWAIYNRDNDIMALLLDHGADPNAPVVNSQVTPPTAFLHAVKCIARNEDIRICRKRIEMLMERGADISQCWATHSVLEVAVSSGNVEIVQMMLNLTSQAPGNYHINGIRMALASVPMNYSVQADVGLLQLLLDNGADINAQDSDSGETVLQKSVIFGRIEVVKFLLQNKAEVNIPATDIRGTPLQEALQGGKIEVADLLIEHGADVNALPAKKVGVTALQAAAIHGFNQVAVKLLKLGADVSARPSPINGRTAIDGAAEYGRLEMLQLLLNSYGDREGLSSVCNQAASFAQKGGHVAIAAWLRAYPAS